MDKDTRDSLTTNVSQNLKGEDVANTLKRIASKRKLQLRFNVLDPRDYTQRAFIPGGGILGQPEILSVRVRLQTRSPAKVLRGAHRISFHKARSGDIPVFGANGNHVL